MEVFEADVTTILSLKYEEGRHSLLTSDARFLGTPNLYSVLLTSLHQDMIKPKF
jgi:hypothetical protein